MSTELDELQVGGAFDDPLATSELVVVAPPADVHHGRITAFTLNRLDNEKQSVSFKIGLESVDNPGLTPEYDIWLPKLWVENIHIDPSTLPSEDGNNQRQQYAIGIANSDKDAQLQQLRKMAFDQGRSLAGAVAPSTIEEYAELMNTLLAGIEVLFTRRADANSDNAQFRKRLRVSGIVDVSKKFDVKFGKKLKKAWEGA